MAYFGKLVEELGSRITSADVTNEPDKSKAKRYINRAARWIYSAHHWEWRQKTGQITLIPNYTTGTCSVTTYNGTNEAAARTVTFSGATLQTAMQGRFFKPNGEDFWHKIKYVDVPNNTIYLETPVVRSTASGLSYDILKRFYYLYGDVSQITDFGRWDGRWGRLEYKSFSNLADEVADVSDDGTPSNFTPFGVDNYEPIYSAGRISGAADSNLLTGTSTEWLGNVFPGDLIPLNDYDVVVKRVETNGRIILANYLTSALDSQTYEARRTLSIGFQFYPNNITGYMTIPFYYLDKMFDMVHETKDRPNLPDEFDEAILTRAEFKWKKDKGDSNWLAIAQLFSAELDGLKSDYRIAKPRYDIFAPEVRGYPGR